MSGEPEAAKPRSPLKAAAILGGLMVLAGVMVFYYLFATGFGDRAPDPGFAIDNRTGQEVSVYVALAPGSEEVLRVVVPPHARKLSGLCGAGELVARTEDGEEIARRRPFGECNETPWVIEPATLPSDA